jgi:ribosomal protein S27AE
VYPRLDVLVIHGTYHWGRQILAFRNDYCLSCGGPRLAFLHRTFDVFHLFFVPFLPLGFWKRWKCGTCGGNPHARVTTAKPLKWIGIALLILFAVVFWTTTPDRRAGKDNDPAMVWTFRIGFPVAAAFAIRHTLKAKQPERLAEKLRLIAANRDSTCPRCGTTLTVATPWYRCGRCGLERRALPAS